MIASEVARAAPVAAVAGLDVVSRFWGLTLSEWFYIAAIIYTVVQAVCRIYETAKGGKND